MLAIVSIVASCGREAEKREGQIRGQPQIEEGVTVPATGVGGHVGVFLVSAIESECGGTFLTRNVVLTAAHCVFQRRPQDWEVRWGAISSSALPRKAVVQRRAIPDRYRQSQAREADYALLALEEGQSGDAEDVGGAEELPTLKVRGWGWIDQNGSRVDLLQEAEMKHQGALGTPVRIMTSIKGKPCLHDSGSGVRQVQQGRSMLVGVLVSADQCGGGGAEAGYIPSEVWSSWVADCLSASPVDCLWER